MKFRELLEASMTYKGSTGDTKIKYSVKGDKVHFEFINKENKKIKEFTSLVIVPGKDKLMKPEDAIFNYLAEINY